MSANDFFLVEDELYRSLYFGIIVSFTSAARSKNTLEASLINESGFLQYLKEMELMNFDSISTVNEFDELSLDGYFRNVSHISRKFIHTSNIINFLQKKYFDLFDDFKILTSEINGKLKRISQKKAALMMWRDDISFLHFENFVNMDSINGGLSSGNALSLNLDQGIALLPSNNKTKLKVKSIKIASGNGTAGNLDHEVDTSTMLLPNVLDGNLDTCFEYQKFDKGPLKLELSLVFFNKKIVNMIEINPFFREGDIGYEIEDILFFRDKFESLSLKKLCPLQGIYINTLNDGKDYTINFLPVECVSMTIKFKQDGFKQSSIDRRGIARDRKNYSIGLRDINVFSCKYNVSGELSSSKIPLDLPSFIGQAKVDIFPKIKDLYSCSLLGRFAGKWSPIEFKEDNIVSENFLLDGDESDFGWKIYLEKKASEFKNKSSYEESLSKLLYEKKYVNKKSNACHLNFAGEVKGDNLSVFAETGLRRTLSNKHYKTLRLIKSESFKFNFMIDGVAATPGTKIIKIDLPLSLKKNFIESNEIGITVNNVDYDEVAYEEDLGEYKYYVSYAENSIFFLRDSFPSRGRIRWYLKPEQLRFFHKSNKIYSKFKFNFDPNKKDIKISALSTRLREKEFSLKSGKKVFFLDTEGIDKDSFIIANTGGYSFVAQPSLKDLHNYTTANAFEIAWFYDERSNMFYIHKEFQTKSSVKLRFKARTRTVLLPKDYDIWDEKSVPVGISIDKEKFKSELIEENLFSSCIPVFSNITNTLETRTKTLDNVTNAGAERFAFELSYPNIIKGSFLIDRNIFEYPDNRRIGEVDFVDGESEFLNITYVENEYTNEIAEQLGVVSFTIGAASLYFTGLGISFDDNGEVFDPSLQNATLNYVPTNADPVGTWSIDSSGTVHVVVGTGGFLPAEIRYSYYYLSVGKEKMRNKYSVDYENSIIYFSDEIGATKSDPKIKYRISNYSAEYDILTRVKDYEVSYSNRSVKVSTQEFPLKKGMVYLFYKKNMYTYSLENVTEYFSPLVYSIGFEFR